MEEDKDKNEQISEESKEPAYLSLPIYKKIESSRKELLDLSLKNALLNCRISPKTNTKGVFIVDENSAVLIDNLVKQNKTLSFLPTKEDGTYEINQEDLKLQTPYLKESLEKKLLGVYYNAKTLIDEIGINVLYLSLGFLKWYDADYSDKEHYAPLVLIPIMINRGNVKDPFKITYSGEELDENLSLKEKLKLEFNIDLPSLENIDSDDFNFEEYCSKVASVIEGKHRWKVIPNRIALGFFSFGNFLMYKDLDQKKWGEKEGPVYNSIIKEILTGESSEDYSGISSVESNESSGKGQERDYLDLKTVVDADSSQIKAISEAIKGKNLVIHGPPGTGKSQTITNIIAQLMAEGKKVLFVAEKMPALDVVKRRLDDAEIGEFCLELHSHKANKKNFLNEIKKSISRPRTIRSKFEELDILTEARDKLDNYAKIVNSDFKGLGVSPRKLFGELALLAEELKEDRLKGIKVNGFESLDLSKFERKYRKIQELEPVIKQIGVIESNPFYGSNLNVVLLSDIEYLKDLIKTILNELELLALRIREIYPDGLDAFTSLSGKKSFLNIIEIAKDKPEFSVNTLNLSDSFIPMSGRVYSFLKDVLEVRKNKKELESLFSSSAWTNPELESIRIKFVKHQSKFYRLFIKEYREVKDTIKTLYRGQLPKNTADILLQINLLVETQSRINKIEKLHPSLSKFLNLDLSELLDLNLNIDEEIKLSYWISELIKIRGDINITEINKIRKINADTLTVSEIESLTDKIQERILGLVDFLKIEDGTNPVCKSKVMFLSFQELTTRLNVWIQSVDDLKKIEKYNTVYDSLEKEGLSEIAKLIIKFVDPGQIKLSFKALWLNTQIDSVLRELPEVRTFDGELHNQSVTKFKQLDEAIFNQNKRDIMSEVTHRVYISEKDPKVKALLREIEKKRKHLPIRKILGMSGSVIQQLRPVFMMSPMSVATYLAQNSITFDVVIFDEASQIKPVDSLGAIMRAKQVIVVGDSKQLPPTSFFSSELENEDDEENETSDMESILGLFCSTGIKEIMLNWHYRSRHESLIAVSNQQFYDNRLHVFPSPDLSKSDLGLILNHIPNSVYDRGGSRTNEIEAKEIALKVISQAKRFPERTLGVVAFSVAQADAIMDYVERLRREDSSTEEFFKNHSTEPFFVKNLENVQGDERDVIFVSIGYGKDANGKLPMNFGPINKQGGERRLNVLFSRAKLRCEIFSNIKSEDLPIGEISHSEGLKALNKFLYFAENGKLIGHNFGGGEPDSPLEESILKEIRKMGYEVHCQVGCAGYSIDLAVVDPNRPGRFMLAVECDGATYHSSLNARDRDRLRQHVLERLGWKFHRIWSTDWFHNKEREIKKLRSALNRGS